MRPISPPLARRGNVTIFDSMQPLYSCMGIPRFRLLSRTTSLLISAVFTCALSLPCHADDAASGLPDAPQPSTDLANERPATQKTGPGRDNMFLNLHLGPAYPLYANNKDTIINPGQHAPPLSAPDKILYAVHEQTRWAVLMPGLISAGYGHAVNTDPKTGTDLGGFGDRLGLTMIRQATDRFSGDGLYTALFHQDPRFYRIGQGTLVHRGLLAVKQTYVRMNDEGQQRPSYSGLLGHATGSFLAMTYYPQQSATATIAARGFGTAVAGDMGSKLLIEFGPDVLRLALRRKP